MLQNKTHLTGRGNLLFLFCFSFCSVSSFEFWSTHDVKGYRKIDVSSCFPVLFFFFYWGKGELDRVERRYECAGAWIWALLFLKQNLFCALKIGGVCCLKIVTEMDSSSSEICIYWCKFMILISVSNISESINFTFDSYIWFYLP